MNGTDEVVLDDHRAPAPFLAGADDRKGHLRQFQARLTERLRQADVSPRVARLGLLIGERRWLVDLAEAGEIVPMPSSITPVPLAQAWFRGLVNLRGALYGVTDLQVFAGGPPTPVLRESRLLAFGASMQLNAALIVSRMLGLHDPGGWREPEGEADVPDGTWVGRALVDGEGRAWHELSLARLAGDERFLSAGR
jgi:twitching motility protein PilI